MTLQVVRDWVVRFNGRGPDGLINGKAPGKPSLLNGDHRSALAQAIKRGPTPYLDGVVRFRLCDLAQWICEECRISVSEETLGREVRTMGIVSSPLAPDIMLRMPKRPRHLKTSPPLWRKSPQVPPRESDRSLVSGRGSYRPEEEDHPPLGQAGNKAVRATLADNAHAVLVMDQAGWHMSNNIVVPANITILPLPPKSPELTPVENIWQFMRHNWLSSRVFKSYEDIVNHCCYAWRTLQDQPWNIISIGRHKWAKGF